RGDGGDEDVAIAYRRARAGGEGLRELFGRLGETVLRYGAAEQIDEGVLDVADFDAVLRTLGAGQRRRDGGQVQRQQLAVVDVRSLGHAEHFLRLEIGLQGGDFLVGAARAAEV